MASGKVCDAKMGDRAASSLGGTIRRARNAVMARFCPPLSPVLKVRLKRAEAGWRDAETRLQACLEELQGHQDLLKEAEADRRQNQALRDELAAVAGLSLPVYITTEFNISTAPRTGPHRNRVCVCSIPKSGTYLVSELLRLLDYEATRLHLWTEGFSDYRFASLQQARDEYHRFSRTLHVSKSLGLIRPGQFVVGHLEYTEEVRTCLAPFKTIFTARDLRDAAVSHMRFVGSTTRGGPGAKNWKRLPDGSERMLGYLDSDEGAIFFRLCRVMTTWSTDPAVLTLPFETLYGDHGEEAQFRLLESLHQFLEIPGRLTNPAELIHDLIGKPTITWSGRRTERTLYWNDAVEERFRSLDGPEINSALGYE